jgi:hypothetical protein
MNQHQRAEREPEPFMCRETGQSDAFEHADEQEHGDIEA